MNKISLILLGSILLLLTTHAWSQDPWRLTDLDPEYRAEVIAQLQSLPSLEEKLALLFFVSGEDAVAIDDMVFDSSYLEALRAPRTSSLVNGELLAPGGVIDDETYRGVAYYSFAQTPSDAQRAAFQKAFDAYEKIISIKFVETFDANKPYSLRYRFDGTGCWSGVGLRADGPVDISIDPNMGCDHESVIMHETFHAFGRLHEQSRIDRDNYVIIHLQNVKSGFANNFSIMSPPPQNGLDVPYEVGSIMHYGDNFFGLDRQADKTLPSFQEYTALTISLTHDQETGEALIVPKPGSHIYQITGWWYPGTGSSCFPYTMGVENLTSATWTPPTALSPVTGWKDDDANGWHDDVGNTSNCDPSARAAGVIENYGFVAGKRARWEELSTQMGQQSHLTEHNDQVIAAFQYGARQQVDITGTGSGSVTLTQKTLGIGRVPQTVVQKHCASACSENYNLNDVVTLNAIAGAASDFVGWEGTDCNIPVSDRSKPQVDINIQKNANCTAQFQVVAVDECRAGDYQLADGSIVTDDGAEVIFSQGSINSGMNTRVQPGDLLYLKAQTEVRLGDNFAVSATGQMRVLMEAFSCP